MSLWSVLSVAGNVCADAYWALLILWAVVRFVTSWRRGQRVELYGDEEERRQAALAAGASAAVADELARKNKIVAIKWYRMETGASLLDAKNAVEQYERALYRYEPWVSVWDVVRYGIWM